MAPELFSDEDNEGFPLKTLASDIYAFGQTMVEVRYFYTSMNSSEGANNILGYIAPLWSEAIFRSTSGEFDLHGYLPRTASSPAKHGYRPYLVNRSSMGSCEL